MSNEKRNLVFLFVLCSLFFVHCSKTGFLEIRNTQTGLTLGRWTLDEYAEFAIEFIHSVNMSPVRETYQLKDRKILLQRVRLYSFGAGMSDLDEGLKLSRDKDAMIICGFNTSFNELNLIIGTFSDHVLFINNEIISLRELAGIPAGSNTHITLQYR